LAKIAVKRAPPIARVLAAGEGWKICDVVCTAGPRDPAFEEQHSQISLAIVVGGSFQYRTSIGHELMTPGSILLGNIGEPFTCRHDHGVGDRCVSFHYSEEYAEAAGFDPARQVFRIPRIPALRVTSPQVARVTSMLACEADHARLEEIAFQVFDQATRLQHGSVAAPAASDPASVARVTRVLRAIEAAPEASHTLAEMAAEARLSHWHFLRCFEEITGTTPKQYLLRVRLRRAALQLKDDSTRIVDIAFNWLRRCVELQPRVSTGVRRQPADVSVSLNRVLRNELRGRDTSGRGTLSPNNETVMNKGLNKGFARVPHRRRRE
jgi:AraC-like DNA-binding protein